jgi:hypothetical protein
VKYNDYSNIVNLSANLPLSYLKQVPLETKIMAEKQFQSFKAFAPTPFLDGNEY